VNELQNLSYTAATSTINISSGTGVALPTFSTTTTDAGLVTGSNGAGASMFLNGNGTWTAPVGTTYAAGTGITLSSNTFSHTAHTGDATGSTSLTVVAIRGVGVSTTAPTNNQILKYNGTNWIPADETAYAAGTGISLSGNTFTNTGDLSSVNELQDLTYTTGTRTINISSGTGVALPLFSTTSTDAGLVAGSNNGGASVFLNGNGTWSAPTGTQYTAGTGLTQSGTTFYGDYNSSLWNANKLQGNDISVTGPSANQVLKWNGAAWAPAADLNTTYQGGTGITLTGNTFSHTAHTGDATGATALTVVAIQGRSVATTIPTSGNYLGWNGSNWIPSIPTGTTYAAGTGLTLGSNTFTANNTTALWNANQLQGNSIATTVPTSGNYLGWNGSSWIPSNPTGTTYAAGTGITLASNTFSHTAHTGDATGSTSLTVVALQGRSVSTTIPTSGNYLGWNGSNWIPSIPTGTTYAAGTGLTLGSNTFTANNTTALWNANQLQGNSIATTVPTSGNYLGWNGSSWIPSIPTGTLYAAGTGITLSSNTFSHTAHTGDATGSTSLTVVALQGRSIATTVPTSGNYLGWNGSSWVPSIPAGTTYAAGTGISLTSNTFTNTGDLSSVNELQDLSYTAASRSLSISSGTGTTLPLFTTTNTDAGLVPGSNNAGATAFLNGAGTWTTPTGTTYAAGTGITLSSNTFSHTAHTGDATGSTSLTVVALQGRSVSTIIPTAGNFLGWNGSSWVPSAASGTSYAAGTGLTLTSNTFSHTAHTGDATGSTSLTVVALQGRSIATTVPTSGNALGWNGSNWLPVTGLLPTGTSGQTIRHNGTDWVATSVIYNNGTQVGIGTTAPSAGITLEVNGRIKTSTIYESSDLRYKDNIKPISNALDKTLALQGVSYTWKPEYAKKNNLTTDEKMIGLIAQDAEKIIPELVLTDDNGYKSIRYSNVVGLLIEAIKEQNKEIEKLRATQLEHNKQIDELKAIQLEQSKKIDELYKLIQKK
jgi:hypothetical protein